MTQPSFLPVATTDFSLLIDDLYEPLYQFALSLCLAESDACDLTLDAFQTWQSQPAETRAAANAKTQLFAILLRDFLARKPPAQRANELEEDTGVVDSPQMEASLINALDGAVIQVALHRLHLRYRAPVSLFYLRRHSYDEMVEILDLPLGTLLSRISRGKAELRKALSYPPDAEAKRSAAKKGGLG